MLASLLEKPSKKALRRSLVASIALNVAFNVPMMILFYLSGDTVPLLASQLSFSADVLRAQYAGLTNIDYYTVAQILDYGFMVAYGMLSFSLALLIGHKAPAGGMLQRSAPVVSLFGPVAAGLDAVENGFILATLSDPAGFPGWWAVAHSAFAAVKWGFLCAALGWAAVAVIALVALKIKARKGNNE